MNIKQEYDRAKLEIIIKLLVAVCVISVFVAVLVCVNAEGVFAAKKVYEGEVEATVVRVIDGDTIVVNIDGWPAIVGEDIGIRVYGIDTRELNDGGTSSKSYAQSLVHPGDTVLLQHMRRGKFFRIVARVKFGKEFGMDWEEHFLEKGLAYPYFGGTKRPLGWKPEDYQ